MDRPGQAVKEGARGERRAAPRRRVKLDVAYEDPYRQIFVAARDVSETGIFLLSPDPPPAPGVPARVMLELPGHPVLLRLRGTVARWEEGTGFALRFDPERTGDDARRVLRRFADGE